MAEDKYAPKAEDGVKEIHAKHTWLIKDQQAANKKAREESNRPKVVQAHEGKDAKEAQPTQPPTSESPSNPSAPQLQPLVPENHNQPDGEQK